MALHFIVKIESYEGEDTYVQCGDESQDYIYCVIAITEGSGASIVDVGYRSVGEAKAAWPDAVESSD